MFRRTKRYSDEDRRLRDWLVADAQRGDRQWTADAAARDGDRDEQLTKTGRAALAVVGALILFLLVAELSDRFIGHAGLLAVLVAAAALGFYSGFWPARHTPSLSYHRRQSQAGFVVLLFAIGVTVWFGMREANALDELATFITPVPEVTDVLYVPTGPELQAMNAVLSGVAPQPGGTTEFSSYRSRYWKLETTLLPDAVLEFYGNAANRDGWTIASADGSLLDMRRGAEQLIVFLSSEWDGGTAVWYILRST